MNCRHCNRNLNLLFLDLGFAPPSNAYLAREDLCRPELHLPLRLLACEHCWLVQTEDYARPEELFREDYAYFSSSSETWREHAVRYVSAISQRLSLGSESFVIEVGSNDGYLLRHFLSAGINCLGIEPTKSTALEAEKIGISVLREFFTKSLAEQLAASGRKADLIVGNNVYAHVPNINDFTAGLAAVLKSRGTVTLEFPHLKCLIEHAQFDTVYHEHFSYLSLYTASKVFGRNGLRIYDVEELSTHGGSLRVYGCHADDPRVASERVEGVIADEAKFGLRSKATYLDFQQRVDRTKDDLLAFLIDCKRRGKKVAAYGAAAKGNTLLNYAGIKRDLLPFVCDVAPSKQGKYLPGSHIEVHAPSKLIEQRPDYVLILPWNLSREISQEQSVVKTWKGQFVVAVPKLSFVE